MSSSRQCANDKCQRLSRALCNCCEKYLCLDHLKDHTDRLNEQLTPISDQFNRLADQLNNISLEKTMFIKELDRWCSEAHQQIQFFYQQKRKEFETFLKEEKEEQANQLKKIRHKFEQITDREEATKDNIQLLINNLQSIEQQIYFINNPEFNLIPMIINDNMCIFTQKRINKNLLPLSNPCKTLVRKQPSYTSIAANEEYILISRSSKLCLVNQQMEIEKEIKWKYDNIHDMFFSSSLSLFFIVTSEYLFYLDANTMNLTNYSINIKNIIKGELYCGTSSNESLYLSTNSISSSIYQYKIFPSIQLSKEWKSPFSCRNEEYIEDLRSNISFLSIICVTPKTNQTNLELRSIKTFEKQWIYPITSASLMDTIRCCSLIQNQWLIIDAMNSRLLHIDENGKLIKQENSNSLPRHAIQLDKNHLVILTSETVNLHSLLS